MTAPTMPVKNSQTRVELDTLVWLMEQAFEGDPRQSLLANLQNLDEKNWTALPPLGSRSIGSILEHVGWAKWMYEDYAFGSATLRGDQPPLIPSHGLRSRPQHELMTWLGAGHQRLACLSARAAK